ncbi:unnamed protein product [Clonostachys byssicola]|uniref:BSD domain-containing protein n=1 Tax=Clonostachys byssicola TaxID=160290 RepID=A0A9N9Y7I3_9HYPO|nr:unnamed protein product [Clonostachys byssicola]
MDLAYDHIQEDPNAKDQGAAGEGSKSDQPQPSLNSEIQDAYKAFSNSPWGSRIGGFLGNVVKQGGDVYTQASKELAEVREDATKGLSDLQKSIIEQTRHMTVKDVTLSSDVLEENKDDAAQSRDLPSDGQPSETMLSRLRAEAAKRLKDLQRAEDAADEALFRFGGNVRDFLRDAVSIAPSDGTEGGSTVLFESKDSKGKRVFHTSRFDAQLHVIHTTTDGFLKDPAANEYDIWTKEFDVEKKTGDISNDLTKYPELRTTMEKLVPDQIPYADFWKRYYYLRHGIETAEARRKDLLKAAAAEDEVGWGDDSDDEEEDDEKEDAKKEVSKKEDAKKAEPKKEEPKKEDAKKAVPSKPVAKEESSDEDSSEEDSSEEESSDDDEPPRPKTSGSVASSRTIQPTPKGPLKAAAPRNSHDEKSQADSEASYDVVGAASGKTSQAPNSPKDAKKADDDDSDDDWE